MLFAAIDPEGWAVIISALCVGIGGIVTSVVSLIIGYRRELAKIERDAAAAHEVQQVKTTLETNTQETKANREETKAELKEMKQTGEATYHLSNSAMEEQKRLLAATARALAVSEPTPVNIAAAEVAEEAYQKHKMKQDFINAEKAGQPTVHESPKTEGT